jgi:MoxR-like ATPase
VATADELLAMQAASRKLYVDPSLVTYAVRLVAATRYPDRVGLKDHGRFILYGASPRASISLIEGGRALAYLRGRDYVLPEDVVDLVPDVLRHRVVPSYEALAEGFTADDLLRDVMRAVTPPEKVLDSHARAANA